MKIGFSPLIARASGRAADLVMAAWKGRAYCRKHVIPHNPQSAAQVLVRNSMGSCVTLWRSLGPELKAWLDKYATAYRMSGYNIFCSKNRAAEQATTALSPVPANPHVAAVADFAGDVGVADTVTVTWTDPVIAGFTKLALFLRDQSKSVFELEIITTLASAETYDFAAVETGVTYDAYGALYNPTTGAFGTVAADLDLLTT